MRLLLDTHVALWAAVEPARLSKVARELLGDDDNALLFSLASAWELAIKSSRSKIRLPIPVAPFVASLLDQLDATLLPIRLEHMDRVETLPFHHSDPFDRLLIAQALCDEIVMLTADAALAAYDARSVRAV